jgi:hypothetical protein
VDCSRFRRGSRASERGKMRLWGWRSVVDGGGRTFWWRRELAVFVPPCAAACGADILFRGKIRLYPCVNTRSIARNCGVVKMAVNGTESSELTLTVLGCGTSLLLVSHGFQK